MVCVCPSFRKAFPFMRNARWTGRWSARVSNGDGTRVRRRRCDKRGRGAARGVSRRAETYVGQAFPNASRFRPIRPNGAAEHFVRPFAAGSSAAASRRPHGRRPPSGPAPPQYHRRRRPRPADMKFGATTTAMNVRTVLAYWGLK